MSYYQKHVFVCNNQKMNGKKCCADSGAADAFSYVKERLMQLDRHGPDKIRVSKSGCLGRCAMGPCLVIYPEGVWYTYQNQADLDEIVQTHLIEGMPVPRLFI
ncbi:ferredoxin [Legionella sp. W05-934-2]|uniref:(2Fe-2S) ferredoxin domain-containing protein n=1 Tax=Legionella sp. W05-934-2 TaxID=1198649 RepID=UPI0034627704